MDKESGLTFYKGSTGCNCCKGYINNCRGAACENLGICYCVADAMHNQEEEPQNEYEDEIDDAEIESYFNNYQKHE